MASKIDALRQQFNGYNNAQKKDFIDKLRLKLRGNNNPALNNFLNECLQKYNNAIQENNQQSNSIYSQENDYKKINNEKFVKCSRCGSDVFPNETRCSSCFSKIHENGKTGIISFYIGLAGLILNLPSSLMVFFFHHVRVSNRMDIGDIVFPIIVFVLPIISISAIVLGFVNIKAKHAKHGIFIASASLLIIASLFFIV